MNTSLLPEQAYQILRSTGESRSTSEELAARIEREIAHGSDVLRWVLTLDPDASAELQVAALLHDAERIANLDTDTGFQGDRNSPEYEQYKRDHALRSATLAVERLTLMGVNPVVVARVAFLIAYHDHTGSEVEELADPDLNTLVAADSFSFFTSIASDMLAREGEERLQKKVYFMVEKMPVFLRKLLAEQDFTDPKHGLDPAAAEVIERVKRLVTSQFSISILSEDLR